MSRPCAVHRMVYGDDSPQATSKFCGLCGEWICDECRPRVDLRFVAWLKKVYGGVSKPKLRMIPGGKRDEAA